MSERPVTPEMISAFTSQQLKKAAAILNVKSDTNALTTQVLWTFKKMEENNFRSIVEKFCGLEPQLRAHNLFEVNRILGKYGFTSLRQLQAQSNMNILLASQREGFDPLSPYVLELAHINGPVEAENGPVIEADVVSVASFEFGSIIPILNPHNPFFTYPNYPTTTQIDMDAMIVLNGAQTSANPPLFQI